MVRVFDEGWRAEYNSLVRASDGVREIIIHSLSRASPAYEENMYVRELCAPPNGSDRLRWRHNRTAAVAVGVPSCGAIVARRFGEGG